MTEEQFKRFMEHFERLIKIVDSGLDVIGLCLTVTALAAVATCATQ